MDVWEKIISVVKALFGGGRPKRNSSNIEIHGSFNDIDEDVKYDEQVKESNVVMPSVFESGIGDFKPDDLADEKIEEAYSILEEVKKTLERQKANETKDRRAHKKSDKERMLPAKQRAEDLKKYFESLTKKPKHHMLCFIMYDIENNRIRTKVAKYLEEKGLKRAQKSVFFGELDKRIYNQIHEVLLEIQSAYENTDSLMMVPVSEGEMKSMRLIGKEIDFEYAIFRGNTMFF
jgi:CRISPR-associated endonuclease Cas2